MKKKAKSNRDAAGEPTGIPGVVKGRAPEDGPEIGSYVLVKGPYAYDWFRVGRLREWPEGAYVDATHTKTGAIESFDVTALRFVGVTRGAGAACYEGVPL